MRRIYILVLAAGCATSTQSAEIPAARTTVLSIPEVRTISGVAPTSTEEVVRKPRDLVIRSIKKTLSDLEIPLTVDDPKSLALGNNNFEKVYRMGTHPMTDFLDCGLSVAGPRATTNRIYMSFITTVKPVNETTTSVKSLLVGFARDMTGGNNRVPCGSTGKLEQLLLDNIKATDN